MVLSVWWVLKKQKYKNHTTEQSHMGVWHIHNRIKIRVERKICTPMFIEVLKTAKGCNHKHLLLNNGISKMQ